MKPTSQPDLVQQALDKIAETFRPMVLKSGTLTGAQVLRSVQVTDWQMADTSDADFPRLTISTLGYDIARDTADESAEKKVELEIVVEDKAPAKDHQAHGLAWLAWIE